MKIQLVTVNSSIGEIERALVEDLGDIVLVCLPDEYRAASDEGRDPIAVGFRRGDVTRWPADP